ncbi:phosphatidic acid phosphatase, putative [Ricinus communis]|uniref:Phosphatidic acid phosphatase, putative n=1 Tax=Ricinus communis TaxID=3988 RepID=B9SFW1_RICCO|nr:phosphatidic acid phosphatase, putative [Ricinus communis]|eukprot:XP_002524880.1 lipid phosphate phosphatase 2 isoform X2 [Ricinus communis]
MDALVLSLVELGKMPEVWLGSHTVRSHGVKVARIHLQDWIILLLLIVIDVILNIIEPFHRFVGQGMMTDLTYPLKPNTVPVWTVPILAGILPLAIFFVYYCYRKDIYDFHHAMLGLLFSLLITGVITDAIKDAVGRPRPNFFWRCFPDGNEAFDPVSKNVICHGDAAVVKEGYKSFPSGHTSWSFAGLTYLAWYISGKLKVFDRRGHIAKLCVVLLPVLIATLVGISRVDDYWHHWTDVFAGALIGTTVAACCYLQSFPYPNDAEGWAPHAFFEMIAERKSQAAGRRANSIRKRGSTDVEAAFMPFDFEMETPASRSSQGTSLD